MTREEEFDWLYRLRSEIYVYMPVAWIVPMNNAVDMAIKELEQEPKWISVSERLPEEEGLYLVSVKNDHQRRYSKTCYFSRKNWFARQDIIAWMPLPKPYEPQESEK